MDEERAAIIKQFVAAEQEWVDALRITAAAPRSAGSPARETAFDANAVYVSPDAPTHTPLVPRAAPAEPAKAGAALGLDALETKLLPPNQRSRGHGLRRVRPPGRTHCMRGPCIHAMLWIHCTIPYPRRDAGVCTL